MSEPFRLDLEPPARLSMSFMRAAQLCHRRAHFDRQGSTSDRLAEVGIAFHDVAAEVGRRAQRTGQIGVLIDDVREVALDVLRHPERVAPLSGDVFNETLRLVTEWASDPDLAFTPGEEFEVDSRIEHRGRTLSARIDRRLVPETSTASIEDYKTGYGDPAPALTFQGQLYALHTMRAFEHIDRVIYRERHVRWGLVGGPWEIHREDLGGIEAIVDAVLERLDRAYAEANAGDHELPPTPGEACSTPGRCPVARTCPAAEWTKVGAEIETEQEALDRLARVFVREAALAVDRDAIRGYLKGSGKRALAVGGQEYGWGTEPSRRFNKRRLARDLAANGVDVNMDDYHDEEPAKVGSRKAR